MVKAKADDDTRLAEEAAKKAAEEAAATKAKADEDARIAEEAKKVAEAAAAKAKADDDAKSAEEAKNAAEEAAAAKAKAGDDARINAKGVVLGNAVTRVAFEEGSWLGVPSEVLSLDALVTFRASLGATHRNLADEAFSKFRMSLNANSTIERGPSLVIKPLT